RAKNHSIEGLLLGGERRFGRKRERARLVERQRSSVLVPLGVGARVEAGERACEPPLVEDLVIRLPPCPDRRTDRVACTEQRRRARGVACRGRETGECLETDGEAVGIAELAGDAEAFRELR